MKNPICFALDVPNIEAANNYCKMLNSYVGAFKVGLELFISSGKIPKTNKDIILDLKLHDIPETVSRAIAAAGDLGVRYMTIHIQQRKTLELALQTALKYDIQLLGVTVLTSMDRNDLASLDYYDVNPASRVMKLANFAYNCGLNSFVCSPNEVNDIKALFPDSFCLVPGIRPVNSDSQDQKRASTPAEAIKNGANLIVIGRPIRDAKDPVAAAKAILQEVESI